MTFREFLICLFIHLFIYLLIYFATLKASSQLFRTFFPSYFSMSPTLYPGLSNTSAVSFTLTTFCYLVF